MKNSISSLKKIASITGLFLGAFAISVAAATWTPPTVAPPDGNIDTPINAGGTAQRKVSALGLGPNNGVTLRSPTTQMLDVVGTAMIDNIVTNSVTVANSLILPTGKGVGRVLTSDENGAATWQAAGGGSSITLSPIKSVTTTGTKTETVGPSSSYSACFLTGSTANIGGSTLSNDCSVQNDGTNWTVRVSNNGSNDSATCSAQCMSFGTGPAIVASCVADVTTTVKDGPAVTWASTVTGGNGTYTYLWNVPDSTAVLTNSIHYVSHNTNHNGSTYTGYHTIGQKNASLMVSSPGSATVTVACKNSTGGNFVTVTN